jgi:hypothetical protein
MTAATDTEHSDHPHVHSDACGHESLRHGDPDFAHDGHLHRAHDGRRHPAHASHHDEH